MKTRKKLNGKISLFIGRDETTIEIEDAQANTTFLKVRLTPEQLSMALSRQAYVDCELEVAGLDRVGKKHEHTTFEFEIPKELATSTKEKELQELAQSQLTDGWIAEGYFSSQSTFFKKGDVQFARCTIRRYV